MGLQVLVINPWCYVLGLSQGMFPGVIPRNWFLSALPMSHLSGFYLLQISAHLMAMAAAL